MIATKRLYLLLALGMIPFAVAFWRPEFMAVGNIYNALLLLLVVADWRLTQVPRLLSATRSVADRLSIGRDNFVTLEIFNQGQMSLRCRARDDYPPRLESDAEEFLFESPPNSKTTLSYKLVPRERGEYQFGRINIRYLSFVGLFWRSARIAADLKVKVFPDLQKLHELTIKLSHSSELGDMHQRRRGQGTEFASLREYAVGDDSKAIDWKATARRDRPVVRTYEIEREQNMLVLVDAGRMMVSDLEGLSRFDHALNAALGLALAGLARNDQVGVGIFADKPLLYLPPRRGKAHLKTILAGVFDARPKVVEPDYIGVLSYFAAAQKGRTLMVVLTDLTDVTGSQTLLAGLASLSPRHLPFCVTLKDRQIDRLANTPQATTEGIFRRAVATDLLCQRELALSVLVRRGCLVLDCPPQELTDKLVDTYLEIKAQGRL